MAIQKKYTGVIVPAVTPLTAHRQIDTAAVKGLFKLFYQHQISPFLLLYNLPQQKLYT